MIDFYRGFSKSPYSPMKQTTHLLLCAIPGPCPGSVKESVRFHYNYFV